MAVENLSNSRVDLKTLAANDIYINWSNRSTKFYYIPPLTNYKDRDRDVLPKKKIEIEMDIEIVGRSFDSQNCL